MYAIIQTGAKQYKVQAGDIIEIEKLGLEAGAEVTFDQVLAVAGEDGKLNIGTPMVEGAKVTGKVLDEFRAKKIVVLVGSRAVMMKMVQNDFEALRYGTLKDQLM